VNGQQDSRQLTWRDAVGALVLATAGGVIFALAIRRHWLSGVAANYGAHAFFLAIPLIWWFRSGRRFPLGRLEHGQLRPWYVLWALAAIGQFAVAFLSPPSTVQIHSMASLIAQLVFLAVFVGPAEEALFRGLIQTGMNASIHASVSVGSWRFQAGTGIAAFLFGIWHFTNLSFQSLGATSEQVASAFFVGLVIGVVYDRTKNLIGACVLHNLIDFLGTAAPLIAYAVSDSS
jgi:membrane protease YdiL (CAAX protease family)